MPLSAVRTIATLLALAIATPALAHEVRIPLAGHLVKVDTRKEPAKHKFLFKAVKETNVVPLHDPATDGSKLLIRWTGSSEGRTELIELDAAFWKGLGNPAGSAGYKYLDKDQTTGVKMVLWKPGPRGGMLKILGGGENFDYEIPANPESVEVWFAVENEWYCADFGGEVKKADDGLFLAKKAGRLASCSETVCGNGIAEIGEQCDDGNLDDSDSCHNDCSLNSDCSTGVSFASTYEGIQEVIYEGYNCTNAGCHDANTSAATLDLTAGASWDETVGVPALQSGLDLIEPADQDVSFLYRKLAARTLGGDYAAGLPGSPMPLGAIPAVTADHLEALRRWIRAGAPQDGVVAETADLLDACLPDAVPNKVEPLEAPPAAEGIQFYGPGWDLEAQSEHEVCYTTWYDFTETGQIPAEMQVPCPSYMGAGKQCFKYDRNLLLQDPQSHHSIETVYTGAYNWTHPSWGGWKCLGGTLDGTSCDPTQFGVSAAFGGAECGERSACASAVINSVACNPYGPPDFTFGALGGESPSTQRFGGSQESRQEVVMPEDVFAVMPMKGYITWNSHAFNLTEIDTTMEQYYNFYFADTSDDQMMRAIFDSDDIFRMNVPPFQKQTVCGHFTLPGDAQLFEISSHAHQHLEEFRVWLPPNNTDKNDVPTTTPDYISRIYNDPVFLYWETPLDFPASLSNRNRRIKYCATYDNGADDPAEVRRHSQSAGLVVLNPCSTSERVCLDGPKKGQNCWGTDGNCDSSPGAGDGVCDACPLRGGVTTFDEMMILLGNYYVPSASQAFLDPPIDLIQ